MNNILSKEVTFANINRIQDIIKNATFDKNNGIINVVFKNTIENYTPYTSAYKTFGVHIKPNILLYYYPVFNTLKYTLSFDYIVDNITDICIYNGMKWNNYSINKKSDRFIVNLPFDFTKIWRIRFNAITNFTIKNVTLCISDDNKDFWTQKKILILGGSEKWMKHNLNKSLITTYGDSIFYNLSYYLQNKYNYMVFNINLAQKESKFPILDGLIQFDECIDIKQKGLYNKDPNFVKKLKTHILNNVACICDHNINVPKNKDIDYLLYTLPNLEYDNTRYIGPGCDATIFTVNKNTSKFSILIDDCYYDPKTGKDYTPEILDACISFIDHDNSIEIVRFGYKDKQSNFEDPYKHKIKNYMVIENTLSIIEKAKFHNKANIWWGTHPESFGMEYLESAMAGCLLVYKKKHIHSFFNKFMTLQYNHISDITLDKLKKYVSYNRQRELALKYNWEHTVDNINKILN